MFDVPSAETGPSVIDLRTDAITPPTEEMWRAMREARLGWSLAGEDENVDELERLGAELTGKEAAVFTATGTLANLVALMTHTRPGQQLVVDDASHILWSEEQGYAQICGLALRALPSRGGFIDPDQLRRALEDSRFGHRPTTTLLCLENTHNGHGGTVLDEGQLDSIADVVETHGIPIHMDGARMLNASVALGVPSARLAARAASLSINLNKGLSAPMGALLCGSRAFVAVARANLRRLGWRPSKAGIEATAGVVALRTMVDRLADDHARARRLAELVNGVHGLEVDLETVQTNIVMCRVQDGATATDALVERLTEAGVRVYRYRPDAVRLVTHRLIDDEAVERAAAAMMSSG